jgi:hypothetical protein
MDEGRIVLKRMADIFIKVLLKAASVFGLLTLIVARGYRGTSKRRQPKTLRCAAFTMRHSRLVPAQHFAATGADSDRRLGHNARDIFRDERGVTTVGMAVAIFLSMALMFSGIQTYRTVSSAADIQDVADACALAAQNEVADFYAVANVCDAAVLTLTLASGLSYGLGIVSACVPALNSLSVKFVELGGKIRESRDSFSTKAKAGLEKYQTLLPYIASIKALNVAKANSGGSFGADYFALSIIVPQTGSSISVGVSDALDKSGSNISDSRDELAEQSQKADEATQAANEAKQLAFELDCGSAPGRCMYERANKLSSISSGDNPLYSSVDTWNFEVGIRRARAYYEARLNDQVGFDASVKEQAKSVLDKRFYQYALDELASAYAIETDTNFEYNIPHFYKNNEEFRSTTLYTERIYPVTESDDQKTMHAWSGCPNAEGATSLGSPSDLDAGGYTQCNQCEFELVSISQVASATTNISTGFEYHYERFRQAAENYKKAKDEAKPALEAAQGIAGSLLDSLKEVFSSAASSRIEVNPPGANGCIAIVVNSARLSADSGITDVFVSGSTTLGTRVAISAAALAVDTSEDGSTVIDGLLDGFELGVAADSAGRVVLGAWSSLLRVYTGGQEKLKSALTGALGGMQTNTVSGIGSWAASKLTEVIEAAGLQPADISIRKSVLVNSARVAESQNSGFSVAFMTVKKTALKASSADGTLLSSLLEASGVAGWMSDVESSFNVASIELPIGGGVSIPISILLPEGAANGLQSLYEKAKEALGQKLNSVAGGQAWQ